MSLSLPRSIFGAVTLVSSFSNVCELGVRYAAVNSVSNVTIASETVITTLSGRQISYQNHSGWKPLARDAEVVNLRDAETVSRESADDISENGMEYLSETHKRWIVTEGQSGKLVPGAMPFERDSGGRDIASIGILGTPVQNKMDAQELREFGRASNGLQASFGVPHAP